VGFLIIIPVGFLLSLIWVLWSVRPQRRPDANDSMQWHRRSMAALDPTHSSAGVLTVGGAVAGGLVDEVVDVADDGVDGAADGGAADDGMSDDGVVTTDALRKGR